MAWTFIIIAGASFVLGTALSIYLRADMKRAHNPYDVERLRADMLDTARSPEELDYLRELDALELHRRHLVC